MEIVKSSPAARAARRSELEFIRELEMSLISIKELESPPARSLIQERLQQLQEEEEDPVAKVEKLFQQFDAQLTMAEKRKRKEAAKRGEPGYASWLWTKVGKRVALTGSRLGVSAATTTLIAASLAPVVGTAAAPIIATVIAGKMVGMGFEVVEGVLKVREEKVAVSGTVQKEEAPLSAEQLEAAKKESRGLLSSVWKNGSWMMGNLAGMAGASALTTLAMNMLMGEGFKLGLDVLTGNWVGAGWRVGKVGAKALLANNFVRTKIYQLLLQKLGTTTIGGAAGKAVYKVLSLPAVSKSIREGKPIPESARVKLRSILGDKTPEWVDSTFVDMFASIAREGVDASVSYAVNHKMNQMNHKLEEVLQRSPERGLTETLGSMTRVAQESAAETVASLQRATGTAVEALQNGVSRGMDMVYGSGMAEGVKRDIAEENMKLVFQQPPNLREDQSARLVSPVMEQSMMQDKPAALRDELRQMTLEKIRGPVTRVTAKEMAENKTLFSLWDQKESLKEQLKEKQALLQELKTDQIPDQLQAEQIDTVQQQVRDLETKTEVAEQLDQAVEELGGLKIKALRGVEITAVGMPVAQKAFSGLFKAAGKTAEYFHRPLSELQESVQVVTMSTGKKWVRDMATGRLVSQEMFNEVTRKLTKTVEIPWKAPEQLGDIGRLVGTASALEAFGQGQILQGVASTLGKEGVAKAIQGAAQISGSTVLQGIAASWNPFSWKLQALRTAGKVTANTAEWLAEGDQNMFIEGIGVAGHYFNSFLDTVNIAGIQEKYLGVPKADLFKIAKRVFMEKVILQTGKSNAEIINSVLGDILWGTVPTEEQGKMRGQFESATLSILSALS